MADITEEFHYWDFDSIQEFESYALAEIDKVCRNNNIHYYIAYGTLLGAKRHGGSIPWDMDADIYIPEQEVLRFVKLAREQFPDDLWINFYDINPNYIYTYPQVGRKGFSTEGMHVDCYPIFGLPRGKKKEKRHLMKIEWQRVFYRAQREIWESRIAKIEKMRMTRTYRFLVKLYTRNKPSSKFIDKLEEIGCKYDIFKDCDNVYDGMRIFPAKWLGEGIDVNYDGVMLKAPDGTEEYLTWRYKKYMEWPDERIYHYIKYSIVNDDVKYKHVAYIGTYFDMTEEDYNELEQLYKESGSIIAIVNLNEIPKDKQDIAVKTAKSIKYFDKIFVNDKGKEEEEKLIEMIDATFVKRKCESEQTK